MLENDQKSTPHPAGWQKMTTFRTSHSYSDVWSDFPTSKQDWQGCQSISASEAGLDWMTFLVTTILTLSGQVWKIDDISKPSSYSILLFIFTN